MSPQVEIPADPSPQVGDTWAVPFFGDSPRGSYAGCVRVLEVDTQTRTCKVQPLNTKWENPPQHVSISWLQKNVLVERKPEQFGPQLQAVLFDMQRQLNLLQVVVDRINAVAAIQVQVSEPRDEVPGE